MDWGYFVGVIASAMAVIFGYIAFARGKKQDTQGEAKQDGIILSEIGYIKANTDEIKSEQKEQRKTNIDIASRLAAVESSAKSAHRRIDNIEGKEPR